MTNNAYELCHIAGAPVMCSQPWAVGVTERDHSLSSVGAGMQALTKEGAGVMWTQESMNVLLDLQRKCRWIEVA